MGDRAAAANQNGDHTDVRRQVGRQGSSGAAAATAAANLKEYRHPVIKKYCKSPYSYPYPGKIQGWGKTEHDTTGLRYTMKGPNIEAIEGHRLLYALQSPLKHRYCSSGFSDGRCRVSDSDYRGSYFSMTGWLIGVLVHRCRCCLVSSLVSPMRVIDGSLPHP